MPATASTSRTFTGTSLARRAMIKVGIRIAVVILLATAIGYFHMKNNLERQTLGSLEKYVRERCTREGFIFALAQDNHRVLAEALLNRLKQTTIEESRKEFDKHVVRHPDGVWRNRPETFDGTRQPGVYIDNKLTVDDDVRHRVAAYYRVCLHLGPALRSRFQDTYIHHPDGILVLYWPERPRWCQNAGVSLGIAQEEYSWVADVAHNPKRQPAWTGLFYDHVADLWMASCETPVDLDGRHVATLGHDIMLNELLQRAVDDHLPDARNVLFRADGRLIAHPDLMDRVNASRGRWSISQGEDEGLKGLFRVATRIEGHKLIGVNPVDGAYLGVGRIPGPGWYFVVELPRKAIAGPAARTARFILLVGLVSLVLEVLILYIILRRQVAVPLGDLVQVTNAVASGDIDTPVLVQRDDELGWLAGSVEHMRSAIRDRMADLGREIGERRKTEEALRTSEEKYRSLVENTSDFIWETDCDSRFTYLSPQMRTLLGYTPEEMLHRPVTDLLDPSGIEQNRQAFLQARDRHGGFVIENTLIHRDGHCVIVETRAAPIFAADGSCCGFRGIDRNITDRRRAEAERLELERQVQSAQKLESLGVLAGGIAHDFNNLLVAILGNASLALDELSPESPAREIVQQIEIAGRRAADLTRQMLAYSGRGRFEVMPLNLPVLVREMSHLLQASISKKVRLNLDFPETLPSVEGDATQIRQVIMNLITNASEAIGDAEGVVTIRLRVVERDAEFLRDVVHTAELKEGPHICVEISDTGCGMDAETLGKMFDPFFTTKFTGRGLGLAAVQGIVRGHKGAIRVKSELGKGTTVLVFFPISSKAPVASAPTEDRSHRLRGEGTVLVVDDEPSVRTFAQAILQRAGFHVLIAADGHEALETFRTNSDRIVAVLLDMTMPRLSGEETFWEMRSIRPDVRVILSSGYTEHEAATRLAGQGLAGFVRKPYQPRDLVEQLIQVIGT